MFVKVFVLGRPGSGKTTAFCHIRELMGRRGWSVRRIRDYEVLREMFNQDHEQRRFRPIAYGGFDVIDFSVLDEALREVEERVKKLAKAPGEKELLIIEFARDEYSTALQIFSPEFLRNTHILFVDADLETCIERVKRRVACEAMDNHYISERIMREYYGRDSRPYMKLMAGLSMEASKEGYSVEKLVHFMNNNGALSDFHQGLGEYVDAIIQRVGQNVGEQSSEPYICGTRD